MPTTGQIIDGLVNLKVAMYYDLSPAQLAAIDAAIKALKYLARAADGEKGCRDNE